MGLQLYDTRLRRKVEFRPLEAGRVRMYVCGITAYDLSHLGHARAYVAFDVVYRYLLHRGYQVTYVRNFTDVDDKIIARAAERGEPWEALVRRYIAAFHEDFDRLGCVRPQAEPRVTEHIPQIVELIERLIKGGHAYAAGNGDVYFEIASFPQYGKLSGRSLDEMQAGASQRTDEAQQQWKRAPLDFALWKASKPGEPQWSSPWGPGRPGWHIECSAMAEVHLGQPFDLHCGGKDLVFPHHENEIAQSEAGFGVEFARHWLHNGFVTLDQAKMAKSEGNFFTVRELFGRYHPQALRYFLLSVQYRHPIDYTDKMLDEALRRVVYVYETLERIDHVLAEEPPAGEPEQAALIEGLLPGFEAAMDDDFNTAAALGHLSEAIRHARELTEQSARQAPRRAATLAALRAKLAVAFGVLGLFDREPAAVLSEIQEQLLARHGLDPAEIEARVAERNEARSARDWARADRIREELAARHVCLMDGPQGTSWKVLPDGAGCEE